MALAENESRVICSGGKATISRCDRKLAVNAEGVEAIQHSLRDLRVERVSRRATEDNLMRNNLGQLYKLLRGRQY